VNTRQKIEVMQAYLDGKTIYYHIIDDEGWKATANINATGEYKDDLGWDWCEFVYEVVEVKPSINWNHVDKKYNWLAVDADGRAYLYTRKPRILEGEYVWGSAGEAVSAKGFASLAVPKDVQWDDSLIGRNDI